MSTNGSIDQIIDDLAFLDEWEDRYRYIIELGKELKPIDDAERSQQTKVRGCASQVWLISESNDDNPPRLAFRGDSDAHIVRGLIAILFRLYSDKTASEILKIDARDVFHRLGLDEHLTPQRSNGFVSMMKRIQNDAIHAMVPEQA
ncbi:MAG: SufE family protein [Alphaproteobacteria bacterium]|nr:MAG: SufE family protein [Alphaproteobacteria bacterium]